MDSKSLEKGPAVYFQGSGLSVPLQMENSSLYKGQSKHGGPGGGKREEKETWERRA